MNDKQSRKELYSTIAEILSNEDDFPSMQAEILAQLAKEDGRLFLVFYLLLIALRVIYWRSKAERLRGDARNIEENALMLETLNTEL